MTDTNPLAAIEALVQRWWQIGSRDVDALSLLTQLRAALAEARQAVDALVAERDAYRRAKQENDERFMLERDEARAERDRLREEVTGHRMMNWPAEAHRLQAERDAAREALARVETLQAHWETALGLNSCPACGHIPEMDCDHGEGYRHALSDIRAVLVQPATDEEAGQ